MDPNPVLIAKRDERGRQIAFVDELLAKVAADGGRDLVEAEIANLDSAKQRIAGARRPNRSVGGTRGPPRGP